MSIGFIQWLIPACIAIVIIFDLVLLWDSVKDNTISAVSREWFKTIKVWNFPWLYCAVSFALGVLMGHWGPR